MKTEDLLIEMKEFFAMSQASREEFFGGGGNIKGVTDKDTSSRRKLNLLYLPMRENIDNQDALLEIMRVM